VRRLRAGELDVAIFLEAGDQPDIAIEPLYPGEPLAAFVADSHPLASAESITPSDVTGESLILFPRAVNPALFDWTRALIEGAGFRFRNIIEATGYHPRDAMVLASQGRGIYISLEHLGHETGAERVGIATCPLDPPISSPEPKLAWLATAPDGHHRRLEVAREVARSLYRESS
jgi:DNA-binding transcriptional LysR family regulator